MWWNVWELPEKLAKPFCNRKALCQVTTILSWLSVDSRAPSAIYIAGDSRITWGSSSKKWDSGRKLFACKSADIFGYCGDVLFPSLAIGQICDLSDRDILWNSRATSQDRHEIITSYLKTSFERRYHAPDHDFTIIHCARDGEHMESSFRAWTTSYHARERHWVDLEIPVGTPKRSKVLATLGSGDRALQDEIDKWEASPQGNTARSISSAFCDALAREVDLLSGGVPQIVCLDRRGGGKVVGYISEETRYLYGLPIQPQPELVKIQWRDSLFQLICPHTLKLMDNAQKHARVDKPAQGGLTSFLNRIGKQLR